MSAPSATRRLQGKDAVDMPEKHAVRRPWGRWLLTGLFVLLLAACVMAAGWLVWRHPDVEEWSDLPFSAIGALAASSIAGLSALVVAETYGEKKSAEMAQRRRELDESLRVQREQAYGVLAHEYLVIFKGGSHRDLAEVRANAALWASEEVIEAMADWNRLEKTLAPVGSDPGHHIVLPAMLPAVHAAVGRVISAMRDDLGASHLQPEAISAMIFNDFDDSEAGS